MRLRRRDQTDAHLHYKPGVLKIVTWNENGEIAETKVVYENGEATFTIDESGLLTWNDLIEDAGKDMRFEHNIDGL